MPLQETSGNVTTDAYGGGVAAVPNYIEDVFSTYLYTGNGSTQTITNNIDLSGQGGLTWIKVRSTSADHQLVDTVRGATYKLVSNTTGAQSQYTTGLTSFNADGFSIGANTQYNNSGATYASWTFRKQPKFFDVVTYTGTGSAQNVAHSLGSVPGCIIVKRLQTTANWVVYHQGLNSGTNPEQYFVSLNTTSAQSSSSTNWNNTAPTSTVFTVGTSAGVNANGETYVAYLFAHNAGGFGLTGTDNVISCGSFTTDSSGNASVNLGYEPQFWLYKPNLNARYWTIYDTMRGWSQTYIANLNPNTSDAEGGGSANLFYPTATGFECTGGALDASTQHIYIAIRRGPMKVPTDATTVFTPIASSDAQGTQQTTGYPVDLQIAAYRPGTSYNSTANDRLRGISSTTTQYNGSSLVTSSTSAEFAAIGTQNWNNTGFAIGSFLGGNSSIYWNFRRAPSFFDEVCYTGTGANNVLNHNLGTTPLLVIGKCRSTGGVRRGWPAATDTSVSSNAILFLNQTNANAGGSTSGMFTSTTVNVGNSTGLASIYGEDWINKSGDTYVLYMFATCAGVSKVGAYTGNGTTQAIACGFTGGARFVLIKRTDDVGGWYVYDTARGMTVLTDPYLFLNSTAAQSATLGSVITSTGGFTVDATILAAINTNGASYIFLAIA